MRITHNSLQLTNPWPSNPDHILRREENQRTQRKTLRARARTNDKLNPIYLACSQYNSTVKYRFRSNHERLPVLSRLNLHAVHEKARGSVEIVKQFFLPLLAHFYITTLSPGEEKESHITMFSAVFLPSCFFKGPQSIYFVASGLVSLPVPGSSEQD